jgi:cytochrome P450
MPGAPRNSGEPNFLYDPSLIMNQEDTTHGSIHHITTQALKPQRVDGYLTTISEIAQGLVAEMVRSGTTADLVAAFTDRLPQLTITKLLGIPWRDCPTLRRWAAAYTLSTPTPPAERAAMVEEFTAYAAEFTTDPRGVPDSPLLQDLAFPPDGIPPLSRHDLTSIVKLLLSAAGTEAPSIVLGRSMLYLLRDRRQWQRLIDAPDTAALVAEEMLRLVYAGDTAALRTAVADVELPSGTIPAGQAVLLAWISALHDPERYEHPEEFELEREGRNIGFGGGRNYCPGVNLAKAVLTIGIRTLAEQLAELRLATPDGTAPIAETPVGSIVRSLPVAW